MPHITVPEGLANAARFPGVFAHRAETVSVDVIDIVGTDNRVMEGVADGPCEPGTRTVLRSLLRHHRIESGTEPGNFTEDLGAYRPSSCLGPHGVEHIKRFPDFGVVRHLF